MTAIFQQASESVKFDLAHCHGWETCPHLDTLITIHTINTTFKQTTKVYTRHDGRRHKATIFLQLYGEVGLLRDVA